MTARGKGGRAGSTINTRSPRMKYFRLLGWSPYNSPSEYIVHLCKELGRLGIAIEDIETHSSPPNGEEVLSELVAWLAEHPGANYSALVDWKVLDIANLADRMRSNPDAKPRIEITAEITKMRNLSVRWYPAGWHDAMPDWSGRDPFNMIGHKVWDTLPDFRWFRGDQPATFDGRATNELMFIRGVGNLHPEPRNEYGFYAKFNHDLVDGMLIAAVRAAYERLIGQLSRSFDVEVLNAFDFEVRDEESDDDNSGGRSGRRVVGWALLDARELRARREREAEEAREAQGRADVAQIAARHNCTFAEFLQALDDAVHSKSNNCAASEQVYRVAAKSLRKAGADINAGDVRRLVRIIGDFMSEELPASLRCDESAAAG
ncbi:MAG TPA: hypothetical protein VN034_03045 [Sphingopyxis sp.]|nr:hypothetical protein [Sphingopyxis sp.]